jgi:GDP-mannose 6-dehydrogenase
MRVSVFGLGYAGLFSAACLTRAGHTVIGTDPEPRRTALTDMGRFLVLDPRLKLSITEAARSGIFRTTLDARSAVLQSDATLICVATPSNANGSLNLRDLDAACIEIGTALAAKDDYHLVVVRSAVLPGTVEGRLTLLIEQHSDRLAGNHFGVCMNPVLPGDGIEGQAFDTSNPVVIGELDARSGDSAQQLYATASTTIVRTSIQTAEMLNYVNKAFHAVRVTFANEIEHLCAAHGIDGQKVMKHSCLDQTADSSAAYVRASFAFDVPCYTKDLRALVYRAKEQDVDCPLLSAALLSNQKQIARAIELVERTRRSRIGILGFGFRAGSADLRENPIVRLAEMLVGKGYAVRIFHDNLDQAQPDDTTGFFLDCGLPHIARLLSSSLQEVLAESDVVLIANRESAARNLPDLQMGDRILIDLAGVSPEVTASLPEHLQVSITGTS